MGLIILEGNETNYKSTIAKKLQKELGYSNMQGSHFKFAMDGNKELNKRMISFGNFDDTILDRYIYSNLVYASIKKDYAILTPEQARAIEDMIRDKAVLVYLHAPTEVLIERLNERGDEYIKADELGLINETYEQVMNGWVSLDMLSFDTSQMNSDEITQAIINHIKAK